MKFLKLSRYTINVDTVSYVDWNGEFRAYNHEVTHEVRVHFGNGSGALVFPLGSPDAIAIKEYFDIGECGDDLPSEPPTSNEPPPTNPLDGVKSALMKKDVFYDALWAREMASDQLNHPHTPEDKIVAAIEVDISDRSGLRCEWELIDDSTKDRILEVWREIIRQELEIVGSGKE